MDNQRLMRELLDVAERLGISVRYGQMGGGSGGGLCVLKGKRVLIVDQDADGVDQINTIAGALANQPEIDEVFVVPQIREFLEEYRQNS